MTFPQRKSPRLKDYDYSQSGAYFVTICTYKRAYIFGGIHNQEMQLNQLGELVYESWLDLLNHFSTIELDAFIVMPNHVHGIVSMTQDGSPLGVIVGTFKAAVTRNSRLFFPDKIWQSRYHDHIIRNEHELTHIRRYVLHNPEMWEEDTFYSGVPRDQGHH